jgi:hypothetical protein
MVTRPEAVAGSKKESIGKTLEVIGPIGRIGPMGL